MNRRLLQIALLFSSLAITTFAVRGLKEVPQILFCVFIVGYVCYTLFSARKLRRKLLAAFISLNLFISFVLLSLVLTVVSLRPADATSFTKPPSLHVLMGASLGVLLGLSVNILYFRKRRLDDKYEKACTASFAIAVLLMDVVW